MHRFALRIHLPVLGQLPIERLAQTFQDMTCCRVPAGRRDERVGDRKPRRLQDLAALAIADVDDHDLKVERLARVIPDEPCVHIRP